MLHIKIIDIKKEKIDLLKAQKFIKSSSYGASIIFTGTVRNTNDNKEVTGITYDSHDKLVLKSFEEIYQETINKLKITNSAVFIEHVKGHVELGEISIIIAIACKHRDQAYILSRYIIEEIKKDLLSGKKNIIEMKKVAGSKEIL